MVHRLIACFCVVIAAALAACVPIQPLPQTGTVPAAATTAGESLAAQVVELTDAGIRVPESMPSGLVAIDIRNQGSSVHSADIHRLNDGVTPEAWKAVYDENPGDADSLARHLGGPNVNAGESALGYYQLEPGQFVVVDTGVAPPRPYATFVVTDAAAAAETVPAADVVVNMTEYAFDLPATVPAGPHLWLFENAGTLSHQFAVVKMNPEATVDDIVAWMNSGGAGSRPFEWVNFWNPMSPGVRTWSTFTLAPGAYTVLDLMDSSAGIPNFEKGMVAELTVQ